MAIPLVYSMRSVQQRWASALVAVLGVTGTVGVLVATLAMARGFRATLVASGSPSNAIVLRSGASTEMYSVLDLEQVRLVEDAPGVARGAEGPLASPEVVVVAAFPLANTGTDANVQVRGVSPRVLAVRPTVRLAEGRFLQPGLAELVVGTNASRAYAGFGVGQTVRFGGGTWTVVCRFDAGGSAFDSELWCDANVLNQTYQRPQNVFQSVTVRLDSVASYPGFADALSTNPRLRVQAEPELAYYEKQSQQLTQMITILGSLVSLVMAVGAIFGALNTMYSAVAERSREIATLRALGFGAGSVVASFVVESVLIATVGGAIACLAVLPLNGFTTGTLNWQTLSHQSFAFKITPGILVLGIGFAVVMGLVGGVLPAIRAARLPVATALREL